MKQYQLGKNGPQVSALALGCMGMSGGMGLTSKTLSQDKESVATIQAALDAGINFLDTGDFYGAGHNESLVAQAIKGRRDDAFLSIKCGGQFSSKGVFLGVDGRPNSIKNYANYSLQRLGVDVIDLYQPCRIDPEVPFEDTIGAIKDLIVEGKVRYLGVSEVGAKNLRLAHSIHPVTALETEYSLACRSIEKSILPTARELGIGILSYRVLADGLLTGADVKIPADSQDPMATPRQQGSNYDHNMKAISFLSEMAAEKQVTTAQLSVAWLLAQGTDLIPLLGMSKRSRVAENIATMDIELSAEDLIALDQAFGAGAIIGDRYPEIVMRSLDQ